MEKFLKRVTDMFLALLTIAFIAFLLIIVQRNQAVNKAAEMGLAVKKEIARFQSEEVFNMIDGLVNSGAWYKDHNNERATLAWAESYIMADYAVMYRATNNKRYLDKLIEHVKGVLQQTDSRRGVTDYRGLSLPAWRCVQYTHGELVIKDKEGKDLFTIYSIAGIGYQTSVEIRRGSNDSTFHIFVTNSGLKKSEEFKDLSMDPSSPRYVMSMVNKGSNLVRISAKENPSRGVPAPVARDLEGVPLIFTVHTGMITWPMALLARIIYENPDLRNDKEYKSIADSVIVEVEKAVSVHDGEWRENEKGEGWYAFAKGEPDKGGPRAEEISMPHNQYLALGRTMIHLYAVTGKEIYLERVTKMARTFKNDLTLQYKRGDEGCYIWTYWWSKDYRISRYYNLYAVEDISHGSIDVGFAYDCYKDGIVFDEIDMKRFANTFMQLIVQKDGGLATCVDGTGGTGRYELTGGGDWLNFAEFNPQIYEVVRNIFNSRTPSGNASYHRGSANLNYWSKVLSKTE